MPLDSSNGRPFPLIRSLPIEVIAATTLGLALVQALNGTSVPFIVGTAVITLAGLLSFSACGGLTTISGWIIAVMLVRGFLLSQVVKAGLLQPAESFLQNGEKTVFVMAAGWVMILAACLVCAPLRRDLVKRGTVLPASRTMILGGWLFGVFGAMAVATKFFAKTESSVVLGMANIASQLLIFGVVLSTAADLKKNPTRSLSGRTMVLMSFGVVLGLAYGEKETTLTPFLAYFLTCVALRFRFRRSHVLAGVACATLTFTVLQPLSLHSRVILRDQTFTTIVPVLLDYFGDPERLMSDLEKYEESKAFNRLQRVKSYYREPLPMINRLTYMREADALIAYTDRNGSIGVEEGWRYSSIIPGFVKGEAPPAYTFANQLARQIGYIGQYNMNTSIGFTFFPVSYAAGGWGFLAISVMIFCAFLLCLDLIFGSFLGGVWGVMAVLTLHHIVVGGNIFGFSHILTRMLPMLLLIKFALTNLGVGERRSGLEDGVASSHAH